MTHGGDCTIAVLCSQQGERPKRAATPLLGIGKLQRTLIIL